MDREVQLGKMLETLIDDRGYRRNRGKISEAVGISPAALSQYIAGRTKPSFDVLVKLANFFEVSLDFLVYGERRRGEAAIDYGPIVKYVDVSLSRLQEATQRHSHLVNRVGAILGDRIDTAVREAADSISGYGAGLLPDDDTLLLESYSDETQIITMDLQYDVIELPDSPDGAAGRFLPVVAANLAAGRSYKFVLPSALSADWPDLVRRLRRILSDMTDTETVANRCLFRVSEMPIFSGTGMYRLDVDSLKREQPNLYEAVSTFVDADGWVAFSIPPSESLLADALQDTRHLLNTKNQFDSVWRRGMAI